nr:MFS transporter [Geomicrobium sp. JCM 19055]
MIGKFNRKIVLFVFMIGTFAIGMTEYVVTGLLTQFATDLHVEIATTGLLLSVYAISVAIFGPILRVITIKVNPKLLLICLTILFIVSNSIAAMAPNFEVLLLSRLLSAAMHAPFFWLMHVDRCCDFVTCNKDERTCRCEWWLDDCNYDWCSLWLLSWRDV